MVIATLRRWALGIRKPGIRRVPDFRLTHAREIESLVAFLDEHQIHRPTHLEPWAISSRWSRSADTTRR